MRFSFSFAKVLKGDFASDKDFKGKRSREFLISQKNRAKFLLGLLFSPRASSRLASSDVTRKYGKFRQDKEEKFLLCKS